MSVITDLFGGGSPSGGATPSAPQAPPPRNLLQEYQNTLTAQGTVAPQLFDLVSKWDPQYAALGQSIYGQTLPTTLGYLTGQILPQVEQAQATANTAQRTADLQDVLSLGPAAAKAFASANPGQAALMSILQNQASNAGPTPLQGEMDKQALANLQLGGSLNPDEERQVTQATRESFNDRGMVLSNPAMFAEALNRTQYSDARQQQRMQQALGVNAQDLQALQANRSFQGNVAVLGNQTDPWMQILGRSSNALQQGQAVFQNPLALNQTVAPQAFNPESQYASDLYNTNYNAEAAANIAAANLGASIYGANMAGSAGRYAANMGFWGDIIGSSMSAMGGAAGAMAMCWVAEELFGKMSKKTKRIRTYVMMHVEDESEFGKFCRLYRRNGRKWAQAIRKNEAKRKIAQRVWNLLDRMARLETKFWEANFGVN